MLIPFGAKIFLNSTINFQEIGLHCLIVFIVVTSVWNLGKWSQTDDTEIWNGEVISKHRDHDTYEDPYDCMCTSDSDGNSSCMTCYETRYTVDWYAKTTLGTITFDKEDSAWRSVYNTPDPTAYKTCKTGQPVSSSRKYINYIKAVPQSLFHENVDPKAFIGKIPTYPSIHHFYQVDRVINIDSKVSPLEVAILDSGLDNMLKTIGPNKQANIIVILTEIDDPSYRYAVEQHWLGGKKNDIVIFIGLDDKKITWVDIMTWALNSGNELFHVTLRDEIKKQKTLEVVNIQPIIAKSIMDLYDRPQMKDYEHLSEEITPPTWVIVIAMILAYMGSLGLVWFFHRTDINFLPIKHR
jgi:hypothetical protein